jgi:hypothetical protein
LAAVKRARASGYEAMATAEERAVEAIRVAREQAPRKKLTELDPHADLVVLRYVGLAANYACGSVLLILDGVLDPGVCVQVFQQTAGALAYQHTGLRAASSPDLRALAIKQAVWEAERQAARNDHSPNALAVQLFHEFLGGVWKDHCDGYRARFAEFADWAMSGKPARA